MTARFLTELAVKRVDINDDNYSWELLSSLVYTSDVASMTFVVPIGFITDFASVPRLPFAYLLAGNTSHAPAVLHDYLCNSKVVDRKMTDKVFLESMGAIGVPFWRRMLMYSVVRAYSIIFRRNL